MIGRVRIFNRTTLQPPARLAGLTGLKVLNPGGRITYARVQELLGQRSTGQYRRSIILTLCAMIITAMMAMALQAFQSGGFDMQARG